MKRVKFFASVLAVALTATAFGQTYTANYTSTAPTIDGVISPGEWGDAASAAIVPSSFNSGFQLMWDDTNLYALITTDYDGFALPFPGQEETYQWDLDVNWNFYIDPNRDNEPTPADDAPDGYQIAVHTYEGSYDCGIDPNEPCSAVGQDPTAGSISGGTPGTSIGTFGEGHIDAQWGNQAQWAGLRDTQIAMINDNATGGVSEVVIPWTDLDAPGGDTGDTGLNLEGVAPVNGEEWSWNLAYVYPGSANFTPIWVGGTPFAAGPHGSVTFDGAPVSGGGGDFDGNGAYECADIDSLVAEIAAGTNDAAFDLTNDGNVDTADRDAWLAEAATANGLASPYLPGDADLSGAVDVSDFNIWNAAKFTSNAAWCAGDFTADGSVDVSDFNEWNTTKFTSSDVMLGDSTLGDHGGINTVPEPSALALLSIAGLSLLGLRRRR